MGVVFGVHLVYFALLVSSSGSLVTKHTVATTLDKLNLETIASAVSVPVLELAQTRLQPEPSLTLPFDDRALASEDLEALFHTDDRSPQSQIGPVIKDVIDTAVLEKYAQEPFEYLRGDILPGPGVEELTPGKKIAPSQKQKPIVRFRFHD